jgi:hypothetical protein
MSTAERLKRGLMDVAALEKQLQDATATRIKYQKEEEKAEARLVDAKRARVAAEQRLAELASKHASSPRAFQYDKGVADAEKAVEHAKAAQARAEADKKAAGESRTAWSNAENDKRDELKKTATATGRVYDRMVAENERALKRQQKEEEAHTRAVDREIQKRGKLQQKLTSSVISGLSGITSLAKSAALAYAAAMETDEDTVKEWMQWFAAIESVSQALSGINGVYNSIHKTMDTLHKLKRADLALNVLLASSERSLCAAKACGSAPAPKGILGRVGAGLGKAWRGVATAGRAAGTFLSGTAGAVLSGVAIGFGAGEVFNYASSGETLTNAVGGAWNARTERNRSQQAVDRMLLERDASEAFYRKSIFSAESRAEAASRESGWITEKSDRLTQIGSNYKNKKEQLRLAEDSIQASRESAYKLYTSGESIGTDPAARERGFKLMAQAREEEMRQIDMLIDKQRLKGQIEMDAAKKNIEIHKTRMEIAQTESDFFNALAKSAKKEREEVVSGLLGSKPGEARRGLAARARLEKDPSTELTYREAIAIEKAGLATNKQTKEAVSAAKARRAEEKFGSAPGGDLIGRLAAEQASLEEAAGVSSVDAALVRADVKVAQDIVIKLEKNQEKEMDALIKSLEPKLKMLLDDRNRLIREAVDAAAKAAVRDQLKGMSKQEIEESMKSSASTGRRS